MKRVIRRCVFETNSSMEHTLSILSEEDFKKYKDGKLIYSYEDYNFHPLKRIIYDCDEEFDNDEYELKEGEYFIDDPIETYDSVCDYLTRYEHEYTTPNGDKIVIFGVFGMC